MSQPIKQFPVQLQTKLQATSLVCPLCSARAPVRGARPRAGPEAPIEQWDAVFICPACGLISSFNLERLSPALLKSLQGTQWAAQLRSHEQAPATRELTHEREANRAHFVSALVISFLIWFVLTGSFNPVDLLWGVVAAFVVARFSYKLAAFDLLSWLASPRRWPAMLSLLWELGRQLLIQNITLSIRVLRPRLDIRPGIVAVPTALRDNVGLTLLGSLITLTPDTVVVDIDQQQGLFYVHWIDVRASEPEAVRELVSADFEERVIRVLQA